MADFTSAEMPQVLTACQENLAGITEGFNQCFLTQSQLLLGELQSWSNDSIPEDIAGPGILLTFQLGEVYLHVAIPEALPLPEWCREPGVSEVSRLQTLPVEWSINILPVEWEAESSIYQYVEDLRTAVQECEPADETSLIKFVVGEDSTGPGFYLIGPSARTYVAPVPEEPEPEAVPVPASAIQPPQQELTPEEMREREDRARRMGQVMNMTVPIIVVMAEKKIALGKLLTMGPGTIISFEKSCDDLLDLCVNNRAICCGEAVKIGEKFGLKVNALQSTADRAKTMQRSKIL